MYSFYLAQDGEQILLPVPPSVLELTVNSNNEIINLLDLGDVNILKRPGLTDVNFTVLIPGNSYSFATYESGFKDSAFFLDKFKSYKKSQKPLRLIIYRETYEGMPLFDQNLSVSLEEYTVTEQAGEEGDLYIALEFKEYRDYLTPKVTVGRDEQDEPVAYVEPSRAAKEPAKQYTVKTGDNLWLIAKRELNNGSRHTEIAELNGLKDPHLITPGQVLQLPS